MCPATRSGIVTPCTTSGVLVVAGRNTVNERALERRAFDGDVAAELLHHAVHRGQAKAAALARRLGREERLEDPLPRGLVHAAAGVAHVERHVGALGQRVRPFGELALVRP